LPIIMESIGFLSNMIHLPTGELIVTNTGAYAFWWSVTSTTNTQVALFVNGVPITQAIYGQKSPHNQNNGQGVLLLTAGDIVTLHNHTTTSPALINLEINAGGSAT